MVGSLKYFELIFVLKNVPERKSTQSIITMPKNVRNQIINIMRPLLKDWSGQEFSKSESDIKLYGIRRYFRNARLALHVDEFPRVIAAILQVIFRLFHYKFLN